MSHHLDKQARFGEEGKLLSLLLIVKFIPIPVQYMHS